MGDSPKWVKSCVGGSIYMYICIFIYISIYTYKHIGFGSKSPLQLLTPKGHKTKNSVYIYMCKYVWILIENFEVFPKKLHFPIFSIFCDHYWAIAASLGFDKYIFASYNHSLFTTSESLHLYLYCIQTIILQTYCFIFLLNFSSWKYTLYL